MESPEHASKCVIETKQTKAQAKDAHQAQWAPH